MNFFFFRRCRVFPSLRKKAWIAFLCLPLFLAAGQLEIIATSDLHGEIGALALLAPHFREHPYAIKVDAGDLVQGNPVMACTGGVPMVEALNALSYDIFVPGNHDFEMGEAGLAQWQKRFRGKILCAQCRSPFFDPASWEIVERQGIRCALIGLTEHKIMQEPALLPEFRVQSDTLGALDRALREISAVRPVPDAIVLIWHNGRYSACGQLGKILAERPEIDAVICAHSHEEAAGAKAGRAAVVQAGAHGSAAVLLTIHKEEVSGKRITSALLRPADPADPEIAAIGEKAKEETREALSRRIGDDPGQREFAVLAAETIREKMGCDAVIFDAPENFSGPVTLGRFLAAFPYNNRYFAVRLTPEEWKKTAEKSPGKKRVRILLFSGKDSPEVTAAVSDYLLRSSPVLRRKKGYILHPGMKEHDLPALLIKPKGVPNDETGN